MSVNGIELIRLRRKQFSDKIISRITGTESLVKTKRLLRCNIDPAQVGCHSPLDPLALFPASRDGEELRLLDKAYKGELCSLGHCYPSERFNMAPPML